MGASRVQPDRTISDEAMRAENLRGAGFMLIAMGAFTCGDAVMKTVAETIPPYQAVMLRGFITAPVLLLLSALTGGLRIDSLRASWRVVTLRTLGEMAATFFFFLALVNLPLATVTSINQSVPLAVTAGAAIFFGEKVGWRRSLAILVGFGGVLLIIRPGADGMNVYALCGLISVFFVVIRDLATRSLRHDVSSIAVALAATFAVTLTASVITLQFDWVPVPLHIWPMIAAAGVLVMTGYIFVIRMMRVGQVAVTTPFRYSSLLWALMLGWFLWGHIPDTVSLIGAGIVVVSGLFTLFYSQRNKLAVEGVSG